MDAMFALEEFSKSFSNWQIHLCHVLLLIWLWWWSKIQNNLFHSIPWIGLPKWGKRYLKQDSLCTSDGHGQELEARGNKDQKHKYTPLEQEGIADAWQKWDGDKGGVWVWRSYEALDCVFEKIHFHMLPAQGFTETFLVWVKFTWMGMVQLKSFLLGEQDCLARWVFNTTFHCLKIPRRSEWLNFQWQIYDGSRLFDLAFDNKMQW